MLIKRSTFFKIREIIIKLQNEIFNINTQYKFMKIKKKLDEEFSIYQEQIAAVAEKYGTIEEGSEYIKVEGENFDICREKINEIENLNIEIQDIYFTLDELENLGLTLVEIELLDPFIKL